MKSIDVITDFTGLHRHVWRFWLTQDHHGISLYLDEMRDETRPTTRHRTWTSQRLYRRMHDGRYHTAQILKVEPEIPIEIAQEALRRARESVVLRRWKGP